MLNKMVKKDEKGFTLIELMIVIAIIGILAAIAIPQFSAYRERAWIASMQADCNSARTAQEAYFVDNKEYTATNADLVPYGFDDSKLSDGNSVTLTAGVNPDQFTVTVTSTKTDKQVEYDSTVGKIETTEAAG